MGGGLQRVSFSSMIRHSLMIVTRDVCVTERWNLFSGRFATIQLYHEREVQIKRCFSVHLTCFVVRVILKQLGNKKTFHTQNCGASKAITPINWGIRNTGASTCVFCSVSKGQQLPHPGGEHVLLWPREEEGFSRDGLGLTAEFTDKSERYWRALLDSGWPKRSSLQSATPLGWHKLQFQHPWFPGAVKNISITGHKIQTPRSTMQATQERLQGNT